MDTKKLRKDYMKSVPKLNEALKHVQEQLCDLPPSDFELETNVKPYASVKRKMELDHVRDPLELSDLVRGRLYFSDQFRHKDIINIIHKLFGNQLTNIDKNADRSKEHGLEYHGIIHLGLNINGVRFELQVLPSEFKPYKDFLHNIYEQFRNPKLLSKLSDKQQGFLRDTHNKIYKKINLQANSNR